MKNLFFEDLDRLNFYLSLIFIPFTKKFISEMPHMQKVVTFLKKT